MKRLLSLMALACVLSSSALAGEIPTGGDPNPVANAATTSTEPGEIPTGGVPAPPIDPGQIPSDGISAEIPSGGLAAILSVLASFA
jgi:hypothetical protein